MLPKYNNFGSFFNSQGLEFRDEWTAGCASTDNISVCSAVIDLQGINSIKLIYVCKTSIAASNAKLNITPVIYGSTDAGSTYSLYKTADVQAITGCTTAELDTLEVDIDTEPLSNLH